MRDFVVTKLHEVFCSAEFLTSILMDFKSRAYIVYCAEHEKSVLTVWTWFFMDFFPHGNRRDKQIGAWRTHTKARKGQEIKVYEVTYLT
jgi:hypothetical protein